ncbi:LysR family transcriptional regulator [Lacrimispora amygdalina]|uniref:LysR family transcriptional regulator n=1 Tax=Lacrimispora amygdalina TaxID=253257 RepID=A0A3E2NEB3_9FIRM|nr:LysR family transcriptional regulator [Clostridium indicum]RFZ79357.1 LysR family transcriptional regulator [Clostridium indicum]
MATLKQLRTFTAVAETLKMSEAAKRLYLSQPTVSQIIADLEKEYETTFFKRYPKRLELTPMGKLFWDRALNVLNSYETLNQSMKNSAVIRPLRIGVTLTIGDTMISDIIEKLKKSHPDISCSVFIENTKILENRLIHNELDIALVEGVILNDKIHTEPIMEDELQLIYSKDHPFSGKDVIRAEDLYNCEFILREIGSGTRSIFENLMQAHHIPYCVKWESYSGSAILDGVSKNLGIGVISTRYVKSASRSDVLHTHPIKDMPMNRYFYLCYNVCHSFNSQMADFKDAAKSMEQ